MAQRLSIKDSVQEWVDKINTALDLQNVDGAFVNQDSSWDDTNFTISGGKVRSGTTILDVPGATKTLPFSQTNLVGVDTSNGTIVSYEESVTPLTGFIPFYVVTTNNTRIVSVGDARTWAYEYSIKQIGIGIYDEISIGLASTDEGDHFIVPRIDSDNFLILYRHDAGPTATQIATYPSIKASLPPFANLQKLKDYTGLFVGQFVSTLGYHFPGDGGGNDYEIVAAGTGTDDGGSYIDLSGSGLQAKGLFDKDLSIMQFGARGDMNISTRLGADDSPSFQSAFNYLADKSNKHLRIPAGNYLIGSQVVLDFISGTSEQSIVISGEGAAVTKIVPGVNNSDGCFRVNLVRNQEKVYFKDMSFVSLLDQGDESSQHNGSAIWVDNTNGVGGSRQAFVAVLENIKVNGDGDGPAVAISTGIWENPVRLTNIYYPLIKDCVISGENNIGDVDRVSKRRASPGYQTAILFEECYSPFCYGTRVLGFYRNGVYAKGLNQAPAWEGGEFSGLLLVGQDNGVKIDHPFSDPSTLGEPGFHVNNSHINSLAYGLWINYHRQICIGEIYFHVSTEEESDETGVDLPASIYVDNSSSLVISDCGFYEPGFYINDTKASVAVKVDGSSEGVNIKTSQFHAGGISIYANSGIGVGSVKSFGNSWGGRGQWSETKRYVDLNNNISALDIGPDNEYYFGVIRKLYASNSNDVAANFLLQGANSDGDLVSVNEVLSRFEDNTAGSETGRWLLYGIKSGSRSLGMDYKFSDGSLSLAGSGSLNIQGKQVVTVQQNPITNSVGGDESSKINEILSALRVHGLINT